ncbi:hypothetical protein F5883DRAFT_521256 [Diaporthe sp. PMI_573]|nr:hypothetical protein F5883DRAFT_521256 [Diaporthaceae sp. PMI_573]
MSAACHVSTCRQGDSPPSKSVSRVKNDFILDGIAEEVGTGDDWGRRTVSAISATVEEGIDLQPLMPACRSSSAAHRYSTTPSLPACRAKSNFADPNRDSIAALNSSRDVEEHPLLSPRPKKGSVVNGYADVNRYGNAVTSEDSTIYAAHVPVTEGDANTETHRIINSAPANSEDAPITVSRLDAHDTDDRLEAARELEHGSISEENDMQFRTRLSRSRIRWGAVRMPEEFYTRFGDREVGVTLGHLTFGTEEQGVDPPEDNPMHVYA